MAKIERRTLYAEQVTMLDATATRAGTTVSINIPRDKFIRRIELKQHGDYNITTLGSAVPAAAPSLIGKIRLIRDGSETLISADPAYLMVMDYLEHGGSPNHRIPYLKVANNQKWESTLSLDFMVNPANPNEVFLYDEATGQVFTVMLPAMDYSSLKLEIDIDSGLSVTSMAGLFDSTTSLVIAGGTAYLDVTLEEVFMEQGDPVITRDNVYELRTVQNEKTLAASQDALPYEVTTGVLMRRMALFQYDDGGYGTPKRPNQETDTKELVERFKLKQTSPISWTMLDEYFRSMQSQDIREYNVDPMEQRLIAAGDVRPEDRDTGVFRGFTVMDFDSGKNLTGALDLTGMKSGDIKLFMKTTAEASSSDKLYVLEHYMI